LRHDFYNIDLADEVLDFCFFRPVEWVGDHPVVSAMTVIVVVSLLLYLYAYPRIKALHPTANLPQTPDWKSDQQITRSKWC